MKHVKRIAFGILCMPFVLIGLLILFELFGLCVNHIATARQTSRLKRDLTAAVDDINITDIYSETGNTSGTGNHVDMLSQISFTSGKSLDELQDLMDDAYAFDVWSCRIDETEAGYVFYLNRSAPFADNIQGH